MGKYTAEQLVKILENHRHWVREDCDGWSRMRADLSGAYLSGADLRGAYLSGAKNVPFIPMACPDTGEFTAWKQCKDDTIVKLLIPADARRLSAGRKCRADKAVVLEIQDKDGNVLDKETVYSLRGGDFAYTVGETVTPRKLFCEDRWQECSSGIHFYINREEAVRN